MKQKVKFLETRVVQDARAGTKDEERYEAGKVYELDEPSAKRWVHRNAAEYAEADVKVSPATAAPPAGAEADAATKRERRKRTMGADPVVSLDAPGEADKPAQ